MFAVNPIRLTAMLFFAGIALLFAAIPTIVAVMALGDMTHWSQYTLPYLGSAFLAFIFTGLVYFARGQ